MDSGENDSDLVHGLLEVEDTLVDECEVLLFVLKVLAKYAKLFI